MNCIQKTNKQLLDSISSVVSLKGIAEFVSVVTIIGMMCWLIILIVTPIATPFIYEGYKMLPNPAYSPWLAYGIVLMLAVLTVVMVIYVVTLLDNCGSE